MHAYTHVEGSEELQAVGIAAEDVEADRINLAVSPIQGSLRAFELPSSALIQGSHVPTQA